MTDPIPFTLLSAKGGAGIPFCFAQPFRKGDVPAGKSLVSSPANIQIQVTAQNRWPDGSLKLAIIAGQASLPAGAPLVGSLSVVPEPARVAALDTKALRATGVTAAVRCGSFGTVAWSGADWDQPFLTWVAGPWMTSWVYRKAVGSDAHLVAWLEVRLFASGAVEVLPWIENGYLQVPGPTNKSATYEFTLGESKRFSAPIDLPHHCRAPLLSGSIVSHWLGPDPGVAVRHDAGYFQSTQLVPSYRAQVDASASVVGSLPSSFQPLQLGSYPSAMGHAGYDASIGLLPEWDVLYLVCTGSDAPGKAVQWNAYSAGRYALHYRDEATHRPLRFSAHPTLVLSQSGPVGVSDVADSAAGDYTPAPSGTAPPTYAMSHHPSMGYMAYLLTGRFYFMEQVQFVATTNYLKNKDTHRSGADGVFNSAVDACTPRGAAWAVRSLAQATCVTPDSDAALRGEFVASLKANVAFNHARYVAKPNNPFGFVHAHNDYSSAPGYFGATWQQDFYTAAYGFTCCLELLVNESEATKASELFAWLSRSITGRLGATSDQEYLYRDAATYAIAMSPSDNPDWVNGSGPWYPDWGKVYDATFSGSVGTEGPYDPRGPRTSGDLRGGLSATGYWANLQPAIAYAVQLNVPGALAAYQRMVNAGNWKALSDAFNLDPVWSVLPASASLPTRPGGSNSKPAWRQAMAPLTWAKIGGNTPSAVDPRFNASVNPNGAGALPPWHAIGGFAMIIEAWGGGAYDQERDVLRLHGGGHGDYAGNEILDCDLGAESPTWKLTMPPTGSIGDPGDISSGGDANAYFDGRPRSTHTYNNLVFVGSDFYNVIGSVYPIGFSGSKLYKFDGTAWHDAGSTAGVINEAYGGVCYDAKRHQLRYAEFGNGTVSCYDIATGTWSRGPQYTNHSGYMRTVYVPTLDVVVCLSSYYPSRFRIFDYGRTAGTNIPEPPVIGTPPTSWYHTGVWVPSLNAIVSWNGGSGFDLLVPPASGDPATSAWTWKRLEASASNVVMPDPPTSHGVYGRFFYSPKLDCLGVINATNQQINVFALG